MTSFISNMIWNSVSGFVEEGKRTVGGYAGDALIKAGDLVEGGGRTIGNGIEKKATGLGTSIGGKPSTKPSAKALPSTARRPAAHRSASLPASTKPASGSGIPLGAKKTPGAAATKKQLTNGVSGAKKTALGAGATASTLPKFTPKPFPTGPASSSSSTNKRSASLPKTNPLPKPFPQGGAANANALPKPYAGAANAYPSSKKTAVKPGQSKPFSAPKADDAEVKPYPGTNTLPGQASRTPVKKYKPAQRYEPPAKRGEVKHI